MPESLLAIEDSEPMQRFDAILCWVPFKFRIKRNLTLLLASNESNNQKTVFSIDQDSNSSFELDM